MTTQLNSTCYDSAFAYCYNSSTEPTYWVIGGYSSSSGYVKTNRDGKQGYVCENYSNYFNREADTVCRSLGYAEGENFPMDELPITANFWTNSFYCPYNVPLLHVCANGQWSYKSHDNGTYDNDRMQCRRSPLSVYCYNKVRLHSKFRNNSGVVLQNRDSTKYRYCSDNVDLNTASVICKQIGFDNARVILPSYAYDHLEYYNMGYYNLSCPSGAVKLEDCTVDFDVNGRCDSGALAVSCDGGNSMPDGVTRILEDGTVEVSKYGIWGTIHELNWDDNDAKVVCKENGYANGAAKLIDHDSPKWMFDVKCSGTESKLADCPYETRLYNQSPHQSIYAKNAAVFCYNPSEVGRYELEHGNYGRLLVTREGVKGFVCDPGYVSGNDERTACKTLGYEHGERFPSSELPYGHMFWTNQFSCDWEAPMLESCMDSDWVNSTDVRICRSQNTFSVYCYEKVRLHVAFRNTTGILLITNKDDEYSVCSEGFDMVSANVSCKQMGFVGVRKILPSYIFPSYRTIKYSNFKCNGNEESLLDCPHNEQGCNDSYVVLECGDRGLPPISNYTMATPDYNNYTPPYNNWNNTDGYTPSYNNTTSNSPSISFITSKNQIAWESKNRRILVWENGQWNGIQVYDNDWDNTDASVACRELGYDEGVVDKNDEMSKNLPKVMFNMRCKGNESRLRDCEHEDTNKQHSFNQVTYASAYCYNTNNVTEVRLVNGNQTNYGMVQVKRNDRWQYFCGSSMIYANVICKQLGFKSGDDYEMDKPSILSTTTVLRNYFKCDYQSYLLDQCTTGEWIEGMFGDICQYYSLTTVYCYGNVRLSSGTDFSTGIVRVYNEEGHENICADNFGQNEADVVCRELGFPLGGKTLPSEAFRGYVYHNYTYQCNGNENQLSQCTRMVQSCSHVNNAAVVSCNDGNTIQGKDGDVKIDSDGEVLTFYHGVWGTICPNTWDDIDADVVCKEQGYLHGLAYRKNVYDVNKPRWVYGVNCTGSELAFKDCDLKFKDTNSTYCFQDFAMAYCYNTLDTQYSLTGGGANYGYVVMDKDSLSGYTCDKYGRPSIVANLVCRNLGFSSGEYYPMPTDLNNPSYWMNDLGCYDNNIPLLELCNKETWVYSNESSAEYVCKDHGILSVYCYGEVRLSSQYKNATGIVVHTRNKDEEYAYCSDGFTIDMAGLICKDLGFTDTAKLLLRSYAFEHYQKFSIRYSNVNCPSGAKSFSDCTYDYNTNTQCIGGALAISCDDGNAVSDNQLKILNDGTLQISKNGIWGTIDGENWGKAEANVVCKSKGYKAGLPRFSNVLNSPRWLYGVECSGYENNLFDCNLSTSPQSNDTKYTQDAGVYCYDPDKALQVTIEHGHYGRVQLTKDGITGYICGLYYHSYTVTDTICKSKGYDYGVLEHSPVPPNDTVFWAYETLNCDMGPPILDACEQTTWYNGTINDLKDAQMSSCESNILNVNCKYNEHSSNSSVPPGGVTYPTNAGGHNTTNSNSGGNTPDPNSGGNTSDPNSGGNTPDPNSGGNTPDPNSGGNTPDPNSGANTPDPNSGGNTPDPNSGNSGSKTSIPSDSNDDSGSDSGRGSSAAIISAVRSCLLLTFVVTLIGNF